jgi:hypothetical protein
MVSKLEKLPNARPAFDEETNQNSLHRTRRLQISMKMQAPADGGFLGFGNKPLIYQQIMARGCRCGAQSERNNKPEQAKRL